MMELSTPDISNLYETLMAYAENEIGKDLSHFKKNLRKYFFLSQTRSLKEFFDGKNDKSRNERKIELIRQLYLGFSIPYSIFHPELREEHLFTKDSPPPAHLREFVPLKYDVVTNLDEREFIQRYVGGLEKYIRSAEQDITVYDYLGKGRSYRPGKGLPYYEEAHREIYGLIETQLKTQNKLLYKRFLALPFSENCLNEHIHNREHIVNTYLPLAIVEMSLETFCHLCRCMQYAFFNSRIEFYLVWFPSRIYHYGIIDQKYIVSEYYRYRKSGDFVPDLMFVEDVSTGPLNKLDDLLRVYKDEIERRFGDLDRACLFYRQEFNSAFEKALDFVENKLFKARENWQKEKSDTEFTDAFEEAKNQFKVWQEKKHLIEIKNHFFNENFS